MIAGFWLGLWHGIIAPITFVISMFSDNVNVYEIHNKRQLVQLRLRSRAGLLLVGVGAGKLFQRTWQDEAGNKRRKVEIQVTHVGPDPQFATAEVTRSTEGSDSASDGPWAAPAVVGSIGLR